MIRLRVPGSLTYRHLALRVISAVCKMDAPPPDGEDEFEAQTVSAFGEAFNNIAIHGYRAGPPGDVDIEIESDVDGIVIRMMDRGMSFDPASIAAPKMEDLPESGMGLFIINAFMDDVEYRPGNPNVLRLAKRRGSRASLSGDGNEDEDDTGADFERRASSQRNFRMRSAARTSPQRAAGGIKIQ